MMKLRVCLPALTALTGIHLKLLPVTTRFMIFFIFRMTTQYLNMRDIRTVLPFRLTKQALGEALSIGPCRQEK